MNKGDTAVLSARVRKEKQTDVIWKSNGEGAPSRCAHQPQGTPLQPLARASLGPVRPSTLLAHLPAWTPAPTSTLSSHPPLAAATSVSSATSCHPQNITSPLARRLFLHSPPKTL